jgi:hypothetical protein
LPRKWDISRVLRLGNSTDVGIRYLYCIGNARKEDEKAREADGEEKEDEEVEGNDEYRKGGKRRWSLRTAIRDRVR